MLVSTLLQSKGRSVVTVEPGTDVRALLALLQEHRIGAVVVSSDGVRVEGIVSERDVVRGLASDGADVLGRPVSSIATRDVHTADPTMTLEGLMRLMTDRRVRHVPVVVDGTLRGIVSIGDVVKHRIVELEDERAALTDYISTAR